MSISSGVASLRQAEAILLARSKAATPAPWRDSKVDGNRYAALVSNVEPAGRKDYGGWDWDENYGGHLVGESLMAQDRAYIATVDPLLGRLLADWLGFEAREHEREQGDASSCGNFAHALAIAAVILGGEPRP